MKLSPVLLNNKKLLAWFLINDISRGIFKLADQEMRSLGLTRAQWWILCHVYSYDGVAQQELADIMDFGKSSVGKLIKTVERKGWVIRKDDEKDARIYRIYLVPEVRPAIHALIEIVTLTVQHPLASLSNAKCNDLIQILQGLVQVLESAPKSAYRLKLDALKENLSGQILSSGLVRSKSQKRKSAGIALRPLRVSHDGRLT